MTARHTVDSITSDELDQLYDRIDRIREVAEAFLHEYEAGPDPCAAAVLAELDSRADKDEPTIPNPQASHSESADSPADTGFVPALPKHFADMPRSDRDPLVIEPYRNDQNQPRWVFRCWGTSTCDGWLSLDHDTEQWARRARDRHVAEAHAEPGLAVTEATDAG